MDGIKRKYRKTNNLLIIILSNDYSAPEGYLD